MDDASPGTDPATERQTTASSGIVCNRPPPRLRIAHFIHRYPPALGGSEAYFARLGRYLVARGHTVTVFTTTARDLEAFRGSGRLLDPGTTVEDGVEVRRYPLLRLPAQRWLLKAASLLPVRRWQA